MGIRDRGYIEQISAEKAKEETEAPNPHGTVERLLLSRQEREFRVAHLRQKKAMEELSSLQDGPNINRNYHFKRPRIPIAKRVVEELDYDEEMEYKR